MIRVCFNHREHRAHREHREGFVEEKKQQKGSGKERNWPKIKGVSWPFLFNSSFSVASVISVPSVVKSTKESSSWRKKR
jgi:hypothetical protein